MAVLQLITRVVDRDGSCRDASVIYTIDSLSFGAGLCNQLCGGCACSLAAFLPTTQSPFRLLLLFLLLFLRFDNLNNLARTWSLKCLCLEPYLKHTYYL